MQIKYALTFTRSVLLLAVVSACADQPVTPRVADAHMVSAATALDAYISGPTTVQGGTMNTWYANPSGGDGTYMYQWQYQAEGSNGWTNVGLGPSYGRKSGATSPSFNLKLTVTSAGATVVRGIYVTVEGDDCGNIC